MEKGRRRTCDLDVFPDVLNPFSKRKNGDNFPGFILRQNFHSGELGIVPCYRVEYVGDAVSGCILDLFYHIWVPVLEYAGKIVSVLV